MTVPAGRVSGMFLDDDLREGSGPRHLALVADGAKHGRLGRNRRDGAGILGVGRERPVAGFAVNPAVAAPGPRLNDLVVALLAGFHTGERDGACPVIGQSARPVMTELAEVLGHEQGAHPEEEEGSGREKGGRAKKVLPVLQLGVHTPPFTLPGSRTVTRLRADGNEGVLRECTTPSISLSRLDSGRNL